MHAEANLVSVPPLSSYVAKRCPLRVQLDRVGSGVPLEPTADVQMRLDEGVAFEASELASSPPMGSPRLRYELLCYDIPESVTDLRVG